MQLYFCDLMLLYIVVNSSITYEQKRTAEFFWFNVTVEVNFYYVLRKK